MKRYFLSIAIILAALCAASCVKETMSENSVIVVSQTKQNDFDRWLEANFLLPYNIDFKYRFEMNESDMNYFTIPADYEYSIVMAHLVKYLCVETYDEVAGISFTRSYFPKMFFLTGEWEYRNNGTIILGTAEGGKKIFLAGVNLLKQTLEKGYGEFAGDPVESLNHYFIKTIHHEFTHILNQTIDYPVDFAMITGTSSPNTSPTARLGGKSRSARPEPRAPSSTPSLTSSGTTCWIPSTLTSMCSAQRSSVVSRTSSTATWTCTALKSNKGGQRK